MARRSAAALVALAARRRHAMRSAQARPQQVEHVSCYARLERSRSRGTLAALNAAGAGAIAGAGAMGRGNQAMGDAPTTMTARAARLTCM